MLLDLLGFLVNRAQNPLQFTHDVKMCVNDASSVCFTRQTAKQGVQIVFFPPIFKVLYDTCPPTDTQADRDEGRLKPGEMGYRLAHKRTTVCRAKQLHTGNYVQCWRLSLLCRPVHVQLQTLPHAEILRWLIKDGQEREYKAWLKTFYGGAGLTTDCLANMDTLHRKGQSHL